MNILLHMRQTYSRPQPGHILISKNLALRISHPYVYSKSKVLKFF